MLWLDAYHDDGMYLFLEICHEEGEWYAMGADVHGSDFFFWYGAYRSWGEVHLGCVDEDECMWFLLFDGCCVVLRGRAAVYDDVVGLFFFHLVCDVGSDGIIAAISVADAHEKGRLHVVFPLFFILSRSLSGR